MVDTVESLAAKAKDSAAPAQWVWGLLVFVAALIAGFLISREENAASVAKAEADIQKQRAQDMKIQASAQGSSIQGAILKKQAAKLLMDVKAQQSDLADQTRDIMNRRKRLEDARSWKDLDA